MCGDPQLQYHLAPIFLLLLTLSTSTLTAPLPDYLTYLLPVLHHKRLEALRLSLLPTFISCSITFRLPLSRSPPFRFGLFRYEYCAPIQSRPTSHLAPYSSPHSHNHTHHGDNTNYFLSPFISPLLMTFQTHRRSTCSTTSRLHSSVTIPHLSATTLAHQRYRSLHPLERYLTSFSALIPWSTNSIVSSSIMFFVNPHHSLLYLPSSAYLPILRDSFLPLNRTHTLPLQLTSNKGFARSFFWSTGVTLYGQSCPPTLRSLRCFSPLTFAQLLSFLLLSSQHWRQPPLDFDPRPAVHAHILVHLLLQQPSSSYSSFPSPTPDLPTD